jgi:hypothetical protein
MTAVAWEVLNELATGQRSLLKELPNSSIPKLPGIYALWHDDVLLYVGIARVDPRDTTNPQAAGVPGRLNTYRRCRLTSDFALGCTLRFIVPFLTEQDRAALADGSMTMRVLQPRVQEWVWKNVSFSTVITDAATAVAAESVGRLTGLPGVGCPAFNPA